MDKADIFAFGEEVMAEGNLSKKTIEGMRTSLRLLRQYTGRQKLAIAQSYHNLNRRGFVAPEWLDHTCEDSAGYDNKMFVRTDLMPHRICITDIKTERLQDISEEDCLREGVEKSIGNSYIVSGIMERGSRGNVCFNTARTAYAALINRVSPKIDGKPCWDANPWVFALKFDLIK